MGKTYHGGDLKNLVFYGDGLLCPPEGYGEQIVELLVLQRPDATFKSFHPGEEQLSLEAALRGAPAVIGKAPDFVYIGVGGGDLLRGVEVGTALETLRALLQVLYIKTPARIAVANLCTAFFPQEARAAAAEFNAGIAALGSDRVGIVDLDDPVNLFLEAHRRGAGEKRSLHSHPMRPTSMGRVFLAHKAFALLELESLFPA